MWARGNKYKAKPTRGFPSKLEAAVYDILCLREKNGEIKNIERQAVVVLQPGPPKVRIQWKVDFKFERNGAPCWCEAKGISTGEYRLKLKLWREKRPGRLEIYKGSYKYPKLVEVIE